MEKRDCLSTQIRDDKGFTLVQLLIVVGIIAILMGIALVRFNNALTKAKVKKTEVEIEMMGRAIEQIEEDTGYYIEDLGQLDDTTPPGYPDDTPFFSWWGPYVSSLPVDIEDPWNTSYAYFFWTTPEKGRGKQFQMGNYPPGPPGWDSRGTRTGWGGESLPPGLWRKLGSEEGLSTKGFLIMSAGPDKEIETEGDNIEYGAY